MANDNHLVQAIFVSPLGAVLASVAFSPWLLYQYTSSNPFALGTLPLALKIAALWGIGGYFVALAAVATYGVVIHKLLAWAGKSSLGWYLAAGTAPGAFLMFSPLAYQESVVPGIIFGIVVFALFWRIAVKLPLAANNSSKPTP